MIRAHVEPGRVSGVWCLVSDMISSSLFCVGDKVKSQNGRHDFIWRGGK